MSHIEVPLSGKHGEGKMLLIDPEDLHLIAGRRLSLHDPKRGYIRLYHNGKRQYLHRLILSDTIQPGQNIDHINGDTLDNRRANLRIATQAQNNLNMCKKSGQRMSPYIGVYRDERARSRPWRAQLRINGKVTSLGSFDTEIEAAQARDNAARQHHGEYARLNFPDT